MSDLGMVRFKNVIEELVRLESKFYPSDVKNIKDHYSNLLNNYLTDPSFAWNYAITRTNYFALKKKISDKEVLLRAKDNLIQITQSKQQNVAFIEGIHKTIKIIEILENKIK